MKLPLTFCLILYLITYVEPKYQDKIEPSSENLLSENNNLMNDVFGSSHKNIRTSRGSSSIATKNGVPNSFQCAVMYKDNEPVGILQPYQDSYRVLAVDKKSAPVDLNLAPAKRTIMDRSEEEDGHEESLGYLNDKYPSVFTKFRIDSKLDLPRGSKSIDKRSLTEEDKSETNYNAVEEELGHILDDMSLMDDYPNSNVEIRAGDEDLEIGTNRISLVEEEHTETRQKRDGIDNMLHSNGIFGGVFSEAPKLDIVTPENSPLFSDSKQLEAKSTECVSPAASSQDCLTTVREPIEKQTRDYGKEDTSMLKCNAKLSEEDMDKDMDEEKKRVERGIRDKIRKLKEEVWKEISKLKKSKPKKTQHVAEDTQRKKRQIANTLLDEENSEIDPNLHDDEDEKVHIRRKREV